MYYAPIWKRLLAFVIDSVVMVLMTHALSVVLWWLEYAFLHHLSGMVGFPTVVLPIGFAWLYFALLESSSSGQTLGKRCVNIHVRHITGLRLTFAQASLRWKLRFYLVLGVGAFLIPPLWMNRFRQFLHDAAAESVVLEKRET
ncbi:RDD family protein [Deinococcus cellulosilyticus]|uniref:RDD domain-containing protein n=1 Tax=Deinococcus cellulosilyticus (strain DSM 18568 / NBRC 106333 / KACC 11606 / 5516J-15) TaxID=1223518 RepID=A0A511MX90_DEIC1|nr:hypothetical protein DC3_08150 [Deinococcus cellulosilyticus NBRC 106333 = KACC 11606]